MIDPQIAVDFFRKDAAVRDLVRLANKLGISANESDLVEYIDYLNRNEIADEPEEVAYFVFLYAVNKVIRGLQQYIGYDILSTIAIAFNLLEDSNAHTEAKALYKYYKREVYKQLLRLGEKLV